MTSSTDPDGFTGQGDIIADYVFPIFNVEQRDQGLHFNEFLGTGFFFGDRGYALTAKHVMNNATTPAIAMRGRDRSWRGFAVEEADDHPTEDVSVLRIESPPESQWRSIFALPAGWAGSSTSYFLFGYPHSAMRELVQDGMALIRPDLIYSEGHIRRRISDVPLPKILGSQFFELSQVAGEGCSGSPVVNIASLGRARWHLVGIYIGERLDEYSTSVGYAVRLDDLRDWAPEMLGHSIAEEGDVQQPQPPRPPTLG